jgi:hypothetical protein
VAGVATHLSDELLLVPDHRRQSSLRARSTRVSESVSLRAKVRSIEVPVRLEGARVSVRLAPEASEGYAKFPD